MFSRRSTVGCGKAVIADVVVDAVVSSTVQRSSGAPRSAQASAKTLDIGRLEVHLPRFYEWMPTDIPLLLQLVVARNCFEQLLLLPSRHLRETRTERSRK